MEPQTEDQVSPDVRFSSGYSPQEFAQTLHALAEGKIETEPLITGHSGLDGVAEAFDELAQPDRHAKILVQPGG